MVPEESSADTQECQKDEQVSPSKLSLKQCETFLETEMTKLKLSYFRYIMRGQGSLKTVIILEKIEGGPNMKVIGSIKEARVYSSKGGLLRIDHYGYHSFIWLPGVGANSMAYNC